jgi:AraC-like DNA-binding protein
MDDRLLVLRLSAWLEGHLADGNHGPDLARASGYSENRLRQKFYNITGETPSGYLRKRRLTEAAKALMADEKIVEVAATYGYSSQDNFTTAFKSWFGITPGDLQAMDGKYRTFLKRMKEPLTIMELSNLKQPPLCTTLMGSVKGVSDFLDLDWSTAELFGYSGHAFMMHILKDLCPSGPYTWKMDGFFRALRELGIRKSGEINVTKHSPPEDIGKANDRLRAQLDSGNTAILNYLENQLVVGYDQKGFLFLQPWNCSGDTELASLSFDGWKECLGREGWCHFNLFEKDALVADRESLLRSALAIALRMRKAPEEFQNEGCRAGDGAWEQWIDCVVRGMGTSHGNWWNGMVWKECRSMAAEFFGEIGPGQKDLKAAQICETLAGIYRECERQIDIAKEKEAPKAAQIDALEKGRDLDRRAAESIKELLAIL